MNGPTTISYEGGKPVVVSRSATVRVASGPGAGLSCSLTRHRVRIGTAEDNDLVLDDSHVSRHHLEIRVVDQGYLVYDLGSTNGTYYQGARVQQAMVGAGSDLCVGNAVLRIEIAEESVPTADTAPGLGHTLIGAAPKMKETVGLLAAVAPTDVTVLLQGETGTGKEVAAQALHQHSPRASAPFVVIDCGALPPTLIESELFGHERGAFTGAVRERSGAFERAHGGTVFLDEIGELDVGLQSRLLRVLDRREVRRVGSDHYRKTDVRLIAATNRDLKQRVKSGGFREDLYYRLAVVRIELPPLRERCEDIVPLARHFLIQAGCPDPAAILNEEMVALLVSRKWRGNVRELRNVIERAMALPERAGRMMEDSLHDVTADETPVDDVLSEDWLARVLPDGFFKKPLKEARDVLVEQFETLYLSRLTDKHGNNLSRIARDAGVDRQVVRRILRQRGVGPDDC